MASSVLYDTAANSVSSCPHTQLPPLSLSSAQATMVVVSSLFMIPVVLVFPALYTRANVPPQSATVAAQHRRRRQALAARRKGVIASALGARSPSTEHKYAPGDSPRSSTIRVLPKQLSSGSLRSSSHNPLSRSGEGGGSGPARSTTIRVLPKSPSAEEGDLRAAGADPPLRGRRRGVNVVQRVQDLHSLDVQATDMWRDAARLQALVLRMTGGVLVGTAVTTGVVYAAHAGGLRGNLTASLSAVVAVLAAYGLYALAGLRPAHMPRYLLLQCVAALGLGLCGLFYAAVSLALAAVVVVLAALAMLSVWVVRLLLKCHEQLERLKILKVRLRWANPTPAERAAVTRMQCAFRTQRARTTAIRAAEFAAWLKGCAPHRAALLLLAHACTALAIACLLYVNLVYGVVFDARTGRGWLLTCFFAMLVEGIVQQPLVLMVTAVLGDFVEQGSNVLLDVLIGNN
eukprot:TRINITY_DN1798_c0_g1_i2.p1 TRINITY_DN1798_c0_g1~~TRINITY_DN1798_c0_g1_i2.p1  ORF type:complete len:459 (+),score=174.12 TRINITY_DN1798_c0_g1_i2:317-1693(+)